MRKPFLEDIEARGNLQKQSATLSFNLTDDIQIDLDAKHNKHGFSTGDVSAKIQIEDNMDLVLEYDKDSDPVIKGDAVKFNITYKF